MFNAHTASSRAKHKIARMMMFNRSNAELLAAKLRKK